MSSNSTSSNSTSSNSTSSNSTSSGSPTDTQNLRKGCHKLMDGISTSYGYQPSLVAGAIFCAIFLIAMCGHGFISFKKRRWAAYLLTLGALTELVGWGGRTWSHFCPYNDAAFQMQLTTLIIAPTFFSAAAYVYLGHLINLYGPKSSMISSRVYLYIFCTCDVISLVVQAVGGGLAATAEHKDKSTKMGTNIMVGGIIFQLITMTIFVFFFIDFLRRSSKLLPDLGCTCGHGYRPRAIKLAIAAMMISITAIYIRSVYRTVELLQGWTGYLITHEVYFICLDGAMMVIAVGVYNILDPSRLLPKQSAKDIAAKKESELPYYQQPEEPQQPYSHRAEQPQPQRPYYQGR